MEFLQHNWELIWEQSYQSSVPGKGSYAFIIGEIVVPLSLDSNTLGVYATIPKKEQCYYVGFCQQKIATGIFSVTTPDAYVGGGYSIWSNKLIIISFDKSIKAYSLALRPKSWIQNLNLQVFRYVEQSSNMQNSIN